MYSCTRAGRIVRLAGTLVRQQSDGFIPPTTIGLLDQQQKESPVSAGDADKKPIDKPDETPPSLIPQYSSRKPGMTNFESKNFVTSESGNVSSSKQFTPKISMIVPPKNLSVLAKLQQTKESEPNVNAAQNNEELTTRSDPDNFLNPIYVTHTAEKVTPGFKFEKYTYDYEPGQTKNQRAMSIRGHREAQPVGHGALLDMEKQWTDMVKIAVPFEEVPGPWSFKVIHNILKYVPIIGTQITASSVVYLMDMIGAHLAWQQKVLPFFQLYEQYGPIVRIQGIFGGDIVFLSRPEHIEAVYRQEGRYPVRSSLDSIEQYRLKHRKLRSAGPFIMSGPEWEDLRTKVETPLRNSVIHYGHMIEEVADDFVTRIRDIRNRQEEVPKNFQEEILKWGLESMGLVAYNNRLGCFTETGRGTNATSEAVRLFEAMTNATTSLCACESYIQWWRFFESPSWKKLVTSCDEIDSITSKHIRAAQQRLQYKKEERAAGIMPKLMSHMPTYEPLLETLLLNEQMLPEDILTVVLDMMIIGVTSTCHAITFLLYHLAKTPRVQRQVYEELISLVPDKDTELTFDLLKKMPLLHACVTESLRLNPPIPSMTRVLPKDIAIHNYRIPKGTYVVMTNHVACLKEENFEDATKFKPERWLDDNGDIHPFAAIPFGSGLRSCVGRGLAELQLWMLTAKLVRNFRIEYNYGEIKAKRHFIVMPTKPLKFRFADRSNE